MSTVPPRAKNLGLRKKSSSRSFQRLHPLSLNLYFWSLSETFAQPIKLYHNSMKSRAFPLDVLMMTCGQKEGHNAKSTSYAPNGRSSSVSHERSGFLSRHHAFRFWVTGRGQLQGVLRRRAGEPADAAGHDWPGRRVRPRDRPQEGAGHSG